MKSNIAVQVKELSKKYALNKKPSDIIFKKLGLKRQREEFWALKNVSFEVEKGEIIGILGRNGAGKSTLLKILAGTLMKTSGEVLVNGKISAILELGTGFHPDYTGRENIMMGGMCLGMSKKEILAKMDDIIEFSELGNVIDNPFRTYSSGMQGRLTFSTAMSVSPDIFIVDEALATGDALFQEKCMNRIRKICNSGATVLLVTHSLNHIYEVCTSCILLHEAELLGQGSTKEIGVLYEKLLYNSRANYVKERANSKALVQNENSIASESRNIKGTRVAEEGSLSEDTLSVAVEQQNEAFIPLASFDDSQGIAMNAGISSNNQEVVLLEASVIDEKRLMTNNMKIGEFYNIKIKIKVLKEIASLNMGFQILRETGLGLAGDTTYENGYKIRGEMHSIIEVVFRFKCIMHSGNYILRVGVTEIHEDGSFTPYIDERLDMSYMVYGKNLNGLVDLQSEIFVKG